MSALSSRRKVIIKGLKHCRGKNLGTSNSTGGTVGSCEKGLLFFRDCTQDPSELHSEDRSFLSLPLLDVWSDVQLVRETSPRLSVKVPVRVRNLE